jgi:hypothetical protein
MNDSKWSRNQVDYFLLAPTPKEERMADGVNPLAVQLESEIF